MRLLLINPNTSPDVTTTVANAARAVLPAAVEIVPVTGRFGARYIASRAAAAIAGHAALEALATHVEGCDAALLACFGDPGLAALKELSPVPVVGMAEASCHLACLLGRRFSIVTGGERWPAMLEEFVAAQGLASRLAGIRALAPTGDLLRRDLDAAIGQLAEACRLTVEQDGAEVVVLGGAALAGLAGRVGATVEVPVICSLAAGAQAAVALAALGLDKAGQGSLATPPSIDSVCLADALERRLGGGG
jgi:Asp/Glu/hydantoin racemase